MTTAPLSTTAAMTDFYASQSTFTDPGESASWLDAIEPDLAAIQRVSSSLVFHYRANGDLAEHGFGPDRLAEIDLRYADAMLGRLRELDPASPDTDRVVTDRILGCCRDHTVLFVAIARHKGIPARMRVGFATYFEPGWAVDHVIAEVWDAAEERWRLVEPEIRPEYVDPTDGAVLDVFDMPSDRFVVGAQAWQACRTGDADPALFVVAPDLELPFLRGWPYLAHHLVFDLVALNKQEMILWDVWGPLGNADGALEEPLDDALLAHLDTLAAQLADPRLDLEQLRKLAAEDWLRIPPGVTSFFPLDGRSRQVTLR